MLGWRRVGAGGAPIVVLVATAIFGGVHSRSVRTVGECVAVIRGVAVQIVVIVRVRPLSFLWTRRGRLRLLAAGSPRMAAYIMRLGLVATFLPLRGVEMIRIRRRGGDGDGRGDGDGTIPQCILPRRRTPFLLT